MGLPRPSRRHLLAGFLTWLFGLLWPGKRLVAARPPRRRSLDMKWLSRPARDMIFVYDARGRLVSMGEPAPPDVPVWAVVLGDMRYG